METSDNVVINLTNYFTLPAIVPTTELNAWNMFVPKTNKQYETMYNLFTKWVKEKGLESTFSESVLTMYLNEQAKKLSPDCLKNTYAVLRSTLLVYHNIDIANFEKLGLLIDRCHFICNTKRKKSKNLNFYSNNSLNINRDVQNNAGNSSSKQGIKRGIENNGASTVFKQEKLNNIKMVFSEEYDKFILETYFRTGTFDVRQCYLSIEVHYHNEAANKKSEQGGQNMKFEEVYVTETHLEEVPIKHEVNNLPDPIQESAKPVCAGGNTQPNNQLTYTNTLQNINRNNAHTVFIKQECIEIVKEELEDTNSYNTKEELQNMKSFYIKEECVVKEELEDTNSCNIKEECVMKEELEDTNSYNLNEEYVVKEEEEETNSNNISGVYNTFNVESAINIKREEDDQGSSTHTNIYQTLL